MTGTRRHSISFVSTYLFMPIQDKNAKNGPRKLLALDGGGIRGTITLEILAQLESSLQARLGKGTEFVLADYFDYVAGTSTGAIIATCLSLGMRVAAIQKFYQESGRDMFDKASLLQRFRTKYNDKKLAKQLQEVIEQQSNEAEATLGSKALKTYLLLILRNATTDSPWPLSNNPAAKYNDITRHNCNLQVPLWQLVRASTAAPTYFPPEVVTVGESEFVFVDGGVTMYNNPAFQLFLMATVKPYKLEWPTGEDQMLLVSIGTGAAASANAHLSPDEMNLLYNASSIPSALMYGASNEQDLLCRVFGRCLHGATIDNEVMDLKGDIGPGSLEKKFFTYLRYNADLSRDGLNKLGLPDIKPENVQQMDSVDYIEQLRQVGQKVAEEVDMAHYAAFLS
jgi:patatin-like phospholipase/acyl hydrolase